MGRLAGMGGESIGTTPAGGGGGRIPVEVVRALPADAGAAGIARRCLAEYCVGLPGELIDDAVLLVSELVTNAVQHARPEITLRMWRRAGGLGASVQDCGDRLRLPAGVPDLRAARGRGLRIVAALSSAWGEQPTAQPPGKIIWFEIDQPPARLGN